MSNPARILIATAMFVAQATLASATNYLVTSNADSGAGTLRKALTDANSHPGADTITFILAPGNGTISTLSALPGIQAGGLDITGPTDASGNPIIEIDGSNAGQTAGIYVYGGPTTIKRLAINRFASRGMYATGTSQLKVQGCRIGTNPAGTIGLGNGAAGIYLGDMSGATIGGPDPADGNLISGNDEGGVVISGGSALVVLQNNFIGTNLTGSAAIGNANNGVRVLASNNFIGTPGAGNLISGNVGRGIGLGGTDNVVQGNLIGLDATGKLAIPNTQEGILVNAADNYIGGITPGTRNVVSGNASDGIDGSLGSAGLVVVGNLVGTNVLGDKAVGNGECGITVSGPGSTVGGGGAAGRNVLAGNGSAGILVRDEATGTTVAGNYVGTTASGDAKLGNLGSGVRVFGNGSMIGGDTDDERNVVSGNVRGIIIEGDGITVANNLVGTSANGKIALGNSQDGILVDGDGNTVGGLLASARNVVAATNGTGISVSGTGNTIAGNTVGTDITQASVLGNTGPGIRVIGDGNTIGVVSAGNVVGGSNRGIYVDGENNVVQANSVGIDPVTGKALPNQEAGILILGPGNLIGGSAAGERNVIGGNTGTGIIASGAAAAGSSIQGNVVGLLGDLVTKRPNYGPAIQVYQSFDVLVGGPGAGEGNTIASSGFVGVVVWGGGRNSILGNSIYDNSFAGIDLQAKLGPEENDPLDADLGTNGKQNFPVLGDVIWSAGAFHAKGTLASKPNEAYRVELFSSPICHPTGLGEGRSYLGFVDVVSDAMGKAVIDTSLPGASAAYVTATATDDEGSTSEFSPCNLVGSLSPGKFQFGQPYFLAYEERPFALVTVTRSDGIVGTVTVGYETFADSAQAPADFAATTGTLTFGPGEVIKTFQVPLQLNVATEPQEQFKVRLKDPSPGTSLGELDEAIVYLFDYDPTFPNTTIGDASVTEGDAGTRSLSFTVSVTPASVPVTVKLKTVDGTAQAGTDYDASTFTLVFQPGDAAKIVSVPVHGDTADEGDEQFFLNVTQLSAGSLSEEGYGVILDDDAPSEEPACTGGVALTKPRIVIANLGGVAGDERILFRGDLPFAVGNPAGTTPLDLIARGAQLRIEDLGTGSRLIDLTASATAIPGGLKGALCDPVKLDGWLDGPGPGRYVYKNRSGELSPACAASSAQGLKRFTARDARAGLGKIKLEGRIIGAFAKPVGPLKLTMVLGASQAYGDDGKCGEHTFPALACTLNATGTKLVCS